MKTASITSDTIEFLKALEVNNNREWFAAQKERYLAAQSNMIDFVDEVLILMKRHDHIENETGKKSLFRIYNDVRFSKDKSPYSARFAFGLKRATKMKRGGYTMSIKPGNSYLACGFFAPNSADLLRVRKDIALNHTEWTQMLNLKSIRNTFGDIRGNTVATVPRGFSKDHPAIDLIRHKKFILRHDFTDKEILDPNFAQVVNEMFKSVRPFFDYMSTMLTTNLNGEYDAHISEKHTV